MLHLHFSGVYRLSEELFAKAYYFYNIVPHIPQHPFKSAQDKGFEIIVKNFFTQKIK